MAAAGNVAYFVVLIFMVLPIFIGVSALVSYFVIKTAIKKAVKELKNEGTL
ncbi:MAG TPA: hypothetical protein GX707_05160 [Epulopiscium sp.]|nr:hypothetical protein [Candidatus Epulonipiscium sp.]